MLDRIQRRNEIIITVILTLIFAGLVTYNFLVVQRYNRIVGQRLERHQILETLQLEKIKARESTVAYVELRSLIKSQETADIIKFDTWYKKIEGQYLDQINEISEEFKRKVTNIEELKSLVIKRGRAAEDFKQELINIEDVPEPLDSLYFLLLDFLDNDIDTWNEVLGYYSENFSIENPSIIQDQAISELYLKNSDLYRQVEQLRLETYTEYGLESLL
ncbi:MAG: hypothetical protein MUP02_02970 [Actinobacteria bacterium]|nr:hypothetical protein [Actinomycetota bacterium]